MAARPAPAACADCPVRDQAVCSALDTHELAELSAIGRHRRYARGETILAAGDDSIACATLVSGAVKLSAIDAEGTERIVGLVHPAGLLGQLFAPQVDHHATALADSELCLFPRAGFEALMVRHPALTRAILDRTLRELSAARSLVDLIGRGRAELRVAGLLLAMARAASPSPCHYAGHIELPLTRGEMASMLGLTIETVSRVLTRFEKSGLIERKGARGLDIRDAPQLEEMVAGGRQGLRSTP